MPQPGFSADESGKEVFPDFFAGDGEEGDFDIVAEHFGGDSEEEIRESDEKFVFKVKVVAVDEEAGGEGGFAFEKAGVEEVINEGEVGERWFVKMFEGVDHFPWIFTLRQEDQVVHIA